MISMPFNFLKGEVSMKRKYIFRKYITKNGKKIYPKKAKAFKIPV